MKKLKLVLFSLFLMFIPFKLVLAASFSLSSTTKQVSPGQTFTIKVGGDAIGRVNLSVTNGKLSTSSVWVEQNYVNVSVTAGASGSVVVVATPEVGFSDSDANIYNPGQRSVTINISSSSNSNSNTNTNSNKPNPGNNTPKKSDNNDLASLKVDKGTLSPSFQSSKLEYSLDLPSDTKEIKIDGQATDNKAKIEGLGTKKLEPGNNDIKIIVTAENGNKKTYIIHAYVLEEPDIFMNYKNKEIGIVKNLKNITIPEGFTKENLTFNDKEITTFKKGEIILIYGQNEEKEKSFYIFDKEKNELLNKFVLLKINNQFYNIIDYSQENNNSLEKITINDLEIECSVLEKDNNYCLINAIDDSGNKKEYIYEKREGTMQLFSNSLNYCEQEKTKKVVFPYILNGIFIILIGIMSWLLIKEKRGSKHEKTS